MTVNLPEVNLKSLTERYLANEFINLILQIKKLLFLGYKIGDSKGNYHPLNLTEQYNCMYCLDKIKTHNLGIPIYKKELGEGIQYYTVDIFCDYDCCAAEICKRRHNPLYKMSMIYLLEIFTSRTGLSAGELRIAPDQRLLEIFNGTLSWTEFHSPAVRYTEKVSNIHFIPLYQDS